MRHPHGLRAAAGGSGGGGPYTGAIAFAGRNSPYVFVYEWSPAGFGTKYADPASLFTTTASSLDFHPNKNALAVCSSASPRLSAWQWSASGFGARYTSPTVTAGAADVRYSPDGNYVLITQTTSPFLATYPWTPGGGFGAASPSLSGLKRFIGISFNRAGDVVVFSASETTAASNIYAYPWSSGSYGTKYADPVSKPPYTVYNTVFTPDDSAIIASTQQTPYFHAWQWSASGFGTKYANPATTPSGSVTGMVGLDISPDGSAVVGYALATGICVHAYEWNNASGFGTKYSDPATGPGTANSSALRCCQFSPDGAFVALATSTSPYMHVYNWSSSGFGTLVSSPATIPTAGMHSVAFLPR